MKLKPIKATELSPKEIIGVKNHDIFLQHYRLTSRHEGIFPEKNVQKNFTREEREAIAMCYDRLHDHGFVPTGITDAGQIQWLQRAESVEFRNEYDKDMERINKLSVNEMIAECKKLGFASLVDGMDLEKSIDWQDDDIIDQP